ncbi:hypothetical protein P692DRAFT_201871867 [Suillus brevipes Sb2]|nr:hypothetical protein P692DRAFT_201871867 [Suillus brevipes Sb2]
MTTANVDAAPTHALPPGASTATRTPTTPLEEGSLRVTAYTRNALGTRPMNTPVSQALQLSHHASERPITPKPGYGSPGLNKHRKRKRSDRSSNSDSITVVNRAEAHIPLQILTFALALDSVVRTFSNQTLTISTMTNSHLPRTGTVYHCHSSLPRYLP